MKTVYDPIMGVIQYIACSTDHTNPTSLKVVPTIADRDALGPEYKLVWVLDASADPTVDAGGALYARDEPNGWIKLAETESMDFMVAWDNIIGRPTSSPSAIDQAVANMHVHSNFEALEAYDPDMLMYWGVF